MQDITVWHNPKCSKSRNALAYLETKEIIPTIVKYLDEDLKKEQIKDTLKLLGLTARDWMRTKEDIYIELNLKDVSSEDELIQAMITNPALIERPVVINGNKAVIARPLEKIEEIL